MNMKKDLVESIQDGTFEHDTAQSDEIFNDVKYLANEIDI